MKNELMETNSTGFLALHDFDLANVMSEEMDGLSATFERIKIPSGGGIMFEIPGNNPDEPETVKEFSAVILYQHSLNAYYESEYQGGSNPNVINLKRLLNGKQNVWKYQNGEEKSDSDGREKDV